MTRIRTAIGGVGNCASALIQGIEYYRTRSDAEHVGLMHANIGGYRSSDLEIVAAFDIDLRKVGTPLEEAVFAPTEFLSLRIGERKGLALTLGGDVVPEFLDEFELRLSPSGPLPGRCDQARLIQW